MAILNLKDKGINENVMVKKRGIIDFIVILRALIIE